MSASIDVRISSHYVSLKNAVVTTRIRADRRYRTVGPTPILLVLQHRCSTHIIPARPGILPRRRPGIVGFRRRGLPGGPRGRRPTGCRLVRGELSLDVGRLVSELLPAAGCGKDMVTVSLDDQDPVLFASPSVSLGQDSPRCHRSSGRTAGLKYRGANLSPRRPLPTAGPGYRFTTPPPSTALVRLARVEQSAPPRSSSRFWRPLRPFPLRFGQQVAAFALRHDAGGVSMTATSVAALGVQQRVGVHRQ